MIRFNFRRGCNSPGFTLAELLVSLLIIGEIATFTIPKIISAQQNTQKRALSLEAVSTLSQAMQRYQQAGNTLSASTKIDDMTQYMNYVKVDTSGKLLDDDGSTFSWACDSTYPCLQLHNGGYFHYIAGLNFGGTATTNAIVINFDPDGKYGADYALGIWLYYNGRITSAANVVNGTKYGGSPASSYPDPAWFRW